MASEEISPSACDNVFLLSCMSCVESRYAMPKEKREQDKVLPVHRMDEKQQVLGWV